MVNMRPWPWAPVAVTIARRLNIKNWSYGHMVNMQLWPCAPVAVTIVQCLNFGNWWQTWFSTSWGTLGPVSPIENWPQCWNAANYRSVGTSPAYWKLVRIVAYVQLGHCGTSWSYCFGFNNERGGVTATWADCIRNCAPVGSEIPTQGNQTQMNNTRNKTHDNNKQP